MKRLALGMALIVSASLGFADNNGYRPQYEVTITNLTKASQFTPILAATHRRSISYFELGQPASEGLETMAEAGGVAVLADALVATGKVVDTANSADVIVPPPGVPPLLFAGQTVTLKLEGDRRGQARLSLAAMILPSNDSFVALDRVRLPRYGTRTYYAVGYDAGTEVNDEYCPNIPGPFCGGSGEVSIASEDDEGFVHVANGIAGNGDIPAERYDWRNPIAKVVIRRVR